VTDPPSWFAPVTAAVNVLYDHRLGWLLGTRVLRLTHTGRRSGCPHRTVLEVVGRGPGAELFVVSGFGRRSDWLRNLDAGGPAMVAVGCRSFPADHRRVGGAEAVAVVAAYERRNRLVRLLLHRGLSRLLGWPYRGTDADRRRLVEQLPVIALRPSDRPA
jgi:deazaflavin-dependent oxidoreductase (nitroreductase family)